VKLTGVSVCPGRVLSKSHLLADLPEFDLEIKEDGLNIDEAKTQVDTAIHVISAQLDQTRKGCENNEEMASLLEVQKAMLTDPSFLDDIYQNISEGYGPAIALLRAARIQEDMLRGLDDGFMEMRAEDMRDVSNRTACWIVNSPYPDISSLPEEGVVLTGRDLLPSMLLNADIAHCAGIATESGTRTAHVSVLASSLEIPMVVGCPGVIGIKDKTFVYLDGESGSVEYNFGPDEAAVFEAEIREYETRKIKLLPFAAKETRSAEGERLGLHANVIEPAVLSKVHDYGMDGVGLFRSEFLYMNRKTLPSEEEQFAIYKMAAENLSGKPIIIRTMDIGGDKNIECLKLPREENPFMGCRAIRICLSSPEILITQMKAILRAGTFGNVRIMFPMVATIGELDSLLSLLDKAKNILSAEGLPFAADMPVGIMVEIPSAVITLDTLVKNVDFVSIGSNDLIQYTFAADRLNPAVSYLYKALAPAVLRLIKHTIDVASEAGVECSLCGEMAGDALGMAALAALGLKKFSVSPSFALIGKWRLSLLKTGELKETGGRILAARDVQEVEQILKGVLHRDYF
jgi:phosphotransferase system enzyme I (PtsI)